jgi:hypothetical protein
MGAMISGVQLTAAMEREVAECDLGSSSSSVRELRVLLTLQQCEYLRVR